MRWLDSIPDSVDVSKLQEIVKDRGAWHAAVLGVTKSQTRLNNKSDMRPAPSCLRPICLQHPAKEGLLSLITLGNPSPSNLGYPPPLPQVLSTPSCITTGRQAPPAKDEAMPGYDQHLVGADGNVLLVRDAV